MAGAALLPFAGLIGQKPVIHEGAGTEFKTLSELKEHVQPGDVILSSPKKKGLVSVAVSMGSGTPDVTHASFVDDKRRLISNLNTSPRHGPTIERFRPDRTYTILRPHGVDSGELSKRYRAQLDAMEKLVQEHKPLVKSPAALRELRKQFYSSPGQMLASSVREIFAPKIFQDTSKSRLKSFLKKPTGPAICDTVSGWCSFPGAAAMPEGKPVVPGKRLQDITPTDFLRSEHFKPVGGFGRGQKQLLNTFLKAGPAITRVGLGALGAAAAYGLYEHFKGGK